MEQLYSEPLGKFLADRWVNAGGLRRPAPAAPFSLCGLCMCSGKGSRRGRQKDLAAGSSGQQLRQCLPGLLEVGRLGRLKTASSEQVQKTTIPCPQAETPFACCRRFVVGTCPKCKYEDARGDQVGLVQLRISLANGTARCVERFIMARPLRCQVLLQTTSCMMPPILPRSATPAARC
jgi:hypothetical protein